MPLMGKSFIVQYASPASLANDSQIQVGIASVEAVFNWKKYLNENFGAQYELTAEDEAKGMDLIYTLK